MESSKLRKPVVAGRFYPKDAESINKEISGFVKGNQEAKLKAIGCILPHAGYVYSGRVAAITLTQIDIPDRVILLGPNHTGNGSVCSIMTDGVWQTPLGKVKIDKKLALLILSGSKYLEDDSIAHLDEHSLEVELPLLQYFKDSFEIVPIAFISQELSILKQVGKDIANALRASDYRDRVMFLASSDMTHYEADDQARAKDKKAIEAILELDEDRLMREISNFNISMCGYAPVAVMLSAAKALGAKSGRLVIYQTSGDVTGDKTSVVGYAGIIVN
jgi:AmmeMemoRadiSam system protein B